MIEKDGLIPALLADSRTIAIVGLSAKPDRPSHAAASYLQAHGYRIVPVNPRYAGTHILGECCHATLTLTNAMLAEEGVPIDVVDCFRQPEQLGPVVDEAIAIGPRAASMRFGEVNQEAVDKARRAGLAAVMDRCMEIEQMKLAS